MALAMQYGAQGAPSAQIADTGWIDAQGLLTSDWDGYTDSGITEKFFSYRRWGRVCELRGYIAPTRTVSTSSGNVLICTLPEGFRPAENAYFVVQGAGVNRARLGIQSDGAVYVRAYGTSSAANMTTSALLFISVTWLIN